MSLRSVQIQTISPKGSKSLSFNKITSCHFGWSLKYFVWYFFIASFKKVLVSVLSVASWLFTSAETQLTFLKLYLGRGIFFDYYLLVLPML